MEYEISDFILNVDPKIEIIHNNRTIIKPYEIDIWLPEFNIGIECNPTSTHNSSHNFWNSSESGLLINYHRNKTDKAEESGIQLLHVFSYEWKHRRSIIESILRNMLHRSTRIYARNCIIKEVDTHTAMSFLAANHRQGAIGSSIRTGLYYQDELVSLMTFGKPRHTIGKNGNYVELLRFCNKLNTSVIGGASKLFSYFKETYEFHKIVSFSDRARTSGNLYKILGFQLDHISDPGYVWVDVKTDKAYSRINAQKSNIKKFLDDDSIDLSKSESQIMEEHNFVKVYDSGNAVWVYNIML